jgi:hypothetical protein
LGASICEAEGEIFNILLEASIMFLVAGASSLFWSRLRRPLRRVAQKEGSANAFRGVVVRETPSSLDTSSLSASSTDNSNSDKEAIALTRGNIASLGTDHVVASTLDMVAETTPRFKQFLWLNGLDKSCERLLRRLPQAHVEWIMDQEFVLEVDPTKGSASAKVVSRTQKAAQLPAVALNGYPTNEHVEERLATFVALNHLDARCRTMLEGLPRNLLRDVMDHEFVVKVDPERGSASAKVVGHVIRCRRSSMRQDVLGKTEIGFLRS